MDKYSLQKHTHLVSSKHIYRRAGWHIYNHSSGAVLTGPLFTTYSWGTLSTMCLFGPQLWSNRHLLVSSGFLESAKNLVRHVHLLHCHLLLLLWRLSVIAALLFLLVFILGDVDLIRVVRRLHILHRLALLIPAHKHDV